MIAQRLRLSFAGFALFCICALLIGLDSMRSWQEREAALAGARAQVADLTRSIGAQVEGQVRALDAAAGDIAERMEHDGTSQPALARVQQHAMARASVLAAFQEFYVYDAAGHPMMVPPNSRVPGHSVADREYFVFHRDHPGPTLLISPPMVGSATGRWIIPLTRRWDHPDGNFGGVVVAVIDLQAMQTLYASLLLGRHGVVTLVRDDGTLLLRQPPIPSLLGRTVPLVGQLSALLAQSPAAAVEGRSSMDGVTRLLSYQRIPGYPIVVLVGLGRDDILATWRDNAALHLFGVVALALGFGALGGALLRQTRRQHRSELAAAEASVAYRLLADHATDLIMRVRAGGQRVYASPACRALLGYSPEQMLRRRSAEDLHPDDLVAQTAKWAAPHGQPGVATCTYRMRRSDDTYVWVEETSRALPRVAGAPAENLVVVRDITQRQAVTARLQEANRLLQRAEAITHLGHWRLDLATQAVHWSDEVYNISGWPLTQTPTLQTAIDVYHPDDRRRVSTLVQRAMSSGEAYNFDVRLVRPNGEMRFVTSYGEPEFDGHGRMVALVGTFQDMTDARALEERLRHSQKLEAIGQLAAGVAHDFNNVLQGVLGGLELIMGEAAPGTMLHNCAEIAFRSASRGAALTHQLLSFARKQMLVPRRVEVAPFLEEMRSLLSRTLGPHITVEIAAEATLPSIFVDPDHLHTALINLAANAGQAMPGGGRLRIEAGVEQPMQGGGLVISVSDTGIGMEAATLARATEPFFTTRGPIGSGLGLPMVQGFAQQSGGELRLASVPGQGTVAQIVLPTYVAPPEQPGPAETTAAADGSRILLVDDVPDVLLAAAMFLERSGMQVATAESGDAALALLAGGERFAALVTDYAMPGLNGVELVALAREMQPGLPAVIITGFAEVDTSRIETIATVLRKPFRRQELAEAVLALLAGGAEAAGEPVDADPVGVV